MSRRLMLLLVPLLILSAAGGVWAASPGATPTGTAVQADPGPPVTPEVVEEVPEAPEPPAIEVVPLPEPEVDLVPEPPPAAADEEPDGHDVAAVQQRLADLGFYVGPVDGEAGPATTSAVMAFQKVNRIGVDGTVGPQTLAALDAPADILLRGGAPTRAEIDLDLQVLHLVEGGVRTRTVPISSGSGESYRTASGGTANSVTPVGSFQVERRIQGIRNAPLGTLYDPLYFHKGWAIHGSNSVPAYPASHGCVRVTRADALWLFDRMPVGTPVDLYGGTHVFSPSAGQSAGTEAPAGDTAQGPVEDPTATPPVEPAPPDPEPEPEPQPPADEPPADEPPAEEPPAEEAPAEDHQGAEGDHGAGGQLPGADHGEPAG